MTDRVALYRRKLLLMAVGWIKVVMPVQGQVLYADGPLPSYEIATIKPTPPPSQRIGIGFMPGGVFDTSRTTLRAVIEFAYDLKSSDQLVGATGWMTTDKFDVNAKPDEARRFLFWFVERIRHTKG